MKKTLIAMAILASSGAAMAQSNVSLYGIIDMGLESTDKSGERVTGVDSGLQSTSRIGLKGTEDLGNGLKANFVLESAIAADTGTGLDGFNRQSWLGLSGDFGEVRVGRQYTPIRQALDAVDPFALGLAGSITNEWGVGYGSEDGIQQRVSNSVSYQLPKLVEGLNVVGTYGFGEQEDSISAGSLFSLGASYKLNALNLQAAYENKNLDGTGFADGKRTSYLLGGTYDFGVAKAHASLGEVKNDFTGIGEEKVRNYMVGVSAPVGAAGSVMASYVVTQNRTFDDADSKQFAVGYQYDLSKRTNVYTSYARNTNDAVSVQRQVWGDAKSANTYNVGLRHKF